MKYDKIYQKLKKKYTVEEIAESMMIPADMTKEEKEQSDKEIKEYRMNLLRDMTDEDRILSDVMRLRFQIEEYVKRGKFSMDKTFGKYLAEYIRVVKRTRKEISEDLSIHYTKLSRIINDKEEPNIELSYRLEKHSGNLIRAKVWWKLMIVKHEFIIAKDEETREREQKKVKNFLRA
ncbi:MAG: plasmid maintenance system antidote protein VapI [Nonlabens sp.]|jgi:plasmid maintenance system antidote protein VapI